VIQNGDLGGSMLRSLPYLLLMALWLYALVDCLGTPPARTRGLPKVVWLLIVMLLGEVAVGPLAWLLLGKRRYAAGAGGATPSQWHRAYRLQPAGGEPAGEWIAPDDNPEFLRALSERIRGRGRPDGTQPPEDD
jgi:hypothetical protein